jgi:ABC-type transport system substrate-binding protein
MSLVIDAKEYTRLFMNNRGIPAHSVLAPGIYGHDPEYKNPYRTVNPNKARELLKEAGYPGGIDPKTGRPLRLTFDAPDTSTEALLRFNFWVNQWRKIGLDVRVEATSYNKFQEKVRDGAYQIFQWGWVADYPDPENFMFLLSCDQARSKSGGSNTANYCSPEYDKLFMEMKALENSDRRLDIIRRMLVVLERDRPWIELFYPETYMLFHRWLHNVKPAGLSTPIAKYYDVEPKARAELREDWNEPVVWPAWALLGMLALVIAPGVVTFFKERQ